MADRNWPLVLLGVAIFILGVLTILGTTDAHSETTCSTQGVTTHCWDTATGRTLSTTEQGAGGYAHTWTPDGRAWTHWDHDGRSYTWTTR
jgi:hypothetical protein